MGELGLPRVKGSTRVKGVSNHFPHVGPHETLAIAIELDCKRRMTL
ncbi:hypothetical protein Pla52n_38960 [Stieleria varia]|uniref:Uncharacterized protein n=1 Tax=Stieleria varia TaxID=2528005 RepID=A0A5C6AUU5_9BACT|nr:hypothetical protein Pla52n_38960 [Stieleria varia]